ncbi:hypothetical protein CDIK_2339 [Cucumispora dikerogammari]|nr:hypothetical protein CDIK_2339 [Cucumispora dikerogammari]
MDTEKSPFLEPIPKKEEDDYLSKAIYSEPITYYKYNSETKSFDKTGDCDFYIFKYKKDEDSKEINRISIIQNRLVIKMDFLKTFDCDFVFEKETGVLRFNGIENTALVPVACKFKDAEKGEEALKILTE